MTPKNSAAVGLGHKGGKARARKLRLEERREVARCSAGSLGEAERVEEGDQ